jgi:hypothetical protein
MAILTLVALGCRARAPEMVSAPSRAGDASPLAAAPSVSAPHPSGLLEELLGAWGGPTRCDGFDYFPHGGIRSFYCHRPEPVSVAAIRAAARLEIFVSGPHTPEKLELESRSAFGHYDPAFVRWLLDAAAPSPRGSALQVATQRDYDVAVRPLADVFWKSHVKIRRDAACFTREKALYETAIAKRALPRDYYERWFFFMNPFFCDRGAQDTEFYFDNAFDGGVDGNVTKTVVGFWLRRAIDGTIDLFAEGLERLLSSYEPELLTLGARAPDTAAILRALDGASRAAASCKDPAAPAASSSVEVVFAPDGSVQMARVLLRSAWGSPVATCIEAKFAVLRVPAYDGEPLRFVRPVTLR